MSAEALPDRCDRCGQPVISDDDCAYTCPHCGHVDIGVPQTLIRSFAANG